MEAWEKGRTICCDARRPRVGCEGRRIINPDNWILLFSLLEVRRRSPRWSFGRAQRECRSYILSGKADIAFEHLLDELRLLAGSPKWRAMHDPIAKWSAVSAFTARDRPRNADELGAHFIRAEPNRRIAVAAKVNELEVWGKLRVRNGMGALQVKALRILEA